jgi:4-amino-4-deoxy-L-arabinose transferase-like glycosyltransferase
MQLAAPFCIGMLGWYAWYETGKKFWLFDLYFFGAAATLAKGPVAPFLALCIILLFAGLRREWSLLRRTIWWPGVTLYLIMVLPWYIAVQKRNPTFYSVFFLEHNLERFATNRFQHHQPFFFYLVVLLIGLMPWTVMAIRALVDAIDVSIAEWKVRRNPARYLGHSRAGDAFPEFLVIWAIFPILFFSFSGSKLPGYILPSIPPITILTADYLNRIRRQGLRRWLLWSHAGICGLLVFVLALSPQHMKYETLVPSTQCSPPPSPLHSSSPPSSSSPSAAGESLRSVTQLSCRFSPCSSFSSASTAENSTSTTRRAHSPARSSAMPPT